MSETWADLTKDGRRLNRIINQLETRMKNTDVSKPEELSLYFAYLDRLLKATNTKVGIAEIVLNVKGFLALAKKQHGALPTESGVIKVTSA